MGDRATVEIWECAAAPKSEERPVVLYSHWNGSTLRQQVINAMKRGHSRWNDPAYLSRIIFCEMLCSDSNPLSGTTGFGILTDNVADTHTEIVVDCDRQEVTIKTIGKEWNETYTFDEFILLEGDKRNHKNPDRRDRDNDRRTKTRRKGDDDE